MPVFTTGREDVLSRYMDALTKKTNIRQNVAGSKGRTMGEAFAREIELLSQLEEANQNKAFLSSTWGKFLDYFGEVVGKRRREARNAEVLADDRAIKFYVDSGGTFGSINDSTLFIIPAGTILTAPADVALEASAMFLGVDEANDSIHYIN